MLKISAKWSFKQVVIVAISKLRNSALYLLTFVSRTTAGGGWGEWSCLLSSVLRQPGLSAVAGAVAAQKTLTRWSVSMSSISSSGHEDDSDSAMFRR